MAVRALGVLCAALALVAAACQPLPRPFQPVSKLSSPERVMAPGPRAPMLVAPIVGAPPETSERLGALMAANLRDIHIPATTKGDGGKAYVLEAEVEEAPVSTADALLTLRWRLMDPFGEEVGSFEQLKQVSARHWTAAEPALLAFLAEQAAPRVHSLLRRLGRDRAEVPLAPVFVAPVDGAPGDGRAALSAAMRAALGQHRVPLADEIGDETYLVLGSVYVDDFGPGQQSVEVYWTLIEPSGREIGVVSQSNTVAEGRLDGAWGGIAEAVAEGGAKGVVDILRAVGPIRKGAASE